MEKAKSINATQIRNNFFQVINESFLKDKVYLVEKRGIPLVYIVPANEKFVVKKKVSRKKKDKKK